MLHKAMDILRQNTSNTNTTLAANIQGKGKQGNTGGEGGPIARNPPPADREARGRAFFNVQQMMARASQGCEPQQLRAGAGAGARPPRPTPRTPRRRSRPASPSRRAAPSARARRRRRARAGRRRAPHRLDAAGAPSVLEPRRAAARAVQRRPGPLDGIFERAAAATPRAPRSSSRGALAGPPQPAAPQRDARVAGGDERAVARDRDDDEALVGRQRVDALGPQQTGPRDHVARPQRRLEDVERARDARCRASGLQDDAFVQKVALTLEEPRDVEGPDGLGMALVAATATVICDRGACFDALTSKAAAWRCKYALPEPSSSRSTAPAQPCRCAP